MFEQKHEAKEFVADNLAGAKAEAASFFGVEESALKVVELDWEVAGLAGRAAVVAQPAEYVGKIQGGGDDRGGDRGRDRGDRGGRDRGERGGGGGGGGGRDRGRGRARGRDDDRGGRGRDRDRGDDKPQIEAERLVADGPSKGTADGKLGPIGEFVLGALERMAVGSFTAKESEEGDFIAVELTGPGADALVGGDGRSVDALQLLANQVALRHWDEPKRVIVDVEGDSDKREEFLERLADRAAKRALDTKRSVALDAMNSRDRRLVHVALRDHESVATMSIGEGRYRQVVVVPEGAPDYDEARRSS